MIELRTAVGPEMLEPLEEWFNEMQRCPWGVNTDATGGACELLGYFDDEATAQTAWTALRAMFPALPVAPAQTALNDRNWKEAYKAHLHPWACGDLHWVPVWQRDEYVLPTGHTRLLFDAGLAFGTGDHPTTRLMARRLLDFRAARGQEKFSSARVVDAGCGSGILALSAALLGCRNVFAFDRDPEAVTVSQENQIANDLPAGAAKFMQAGIEEALQDRQTDLLMANIQADVLALHADDLAQTIAPGGTLAMSGILAVEVNDLRAAFESVLADLWNLDAPDELENFGDSRVIGEWCDLVFARPD